MDEKSLEQLEKNFRRILQAAGASMRIVALKGDGEAVRQATGYLAAIQEDAAAGLAWLDTGPGGRDTPPALFVPAPRLAKVAPPDGVPPAPATKPAPAKGGIGDADPDQPPAPPSRRRTASTA